jgi:hypothetical protein
VAEQRRPIPYLTPRGRWSQYFAGIAVETLYVFALCAVGFAIAVLVMWTLG